MKKLTIITFLVVITANLFTVSKVYSQDNSIKLNIGTIQTELKENAISIGIEYVKSLDSLFKSQDILIAQKNSLFQLTPEFNVLTGTEDAFSSINAKLSGILMTFKTTEVSGLTTPCTDCLFNTFPISIGIETNNKFNTVNGIVEIGWVPWYQTAKKTPEWLKHTKIGAFIQGGYKFEIDSANVIPVGGEVDESKEQVDSEIFRLKGDFGIDTKSFLELSGVGIGVVANSTIWYDVLNEEIYYNVKAKLRFYLSSNNDKYFDFEYQKGSGAPNFNQGDQFGMGLKITF